MTFLARGACGSVDPSHDGLVGAIRGEPRFHTSWKTIEANLDRVGAKRVMLTHMAEGMLARRGEVKDPRIVLAEDGLVIDV